MKLPELLAPAGNFERLRTALHFGADAVYLGMRSMSLRNFAENFSLDELFAACKLAHGLHKRVYVTVNAFARDSALRELPPFLRDLQDAGVDALIVNDPGVLTTARDTLPGMKLHLSTQANTLNVRAAAFWHAQGISRIVLARELSLQEVQEMRLALPPELELEIFVHGAMCISYSGRCLLSNYTSGRDSNRGECAQPCRWRYELREQGTNGVYFPIEQDESGTYLLNSRDINLLKHIQAVCATGVSSLKIEGRMKSVYYVAGVINAYRMALDALARSQTDAYQPNGRILEELDKISHRPYTTGFAFGNPGEAGQAVESAQYQQTHTFCAVVLDYDKQGACAFIEQRNRFFTGDTLEILSPADINRTFTVSRIQNEAGQCVLEAPHPQEKLYISCNVPVRAGDILRKRTVL